MERTRLELLSDADEFVLYYPGEVPAEWPTVLLVKLIETAEYNREWSETCGPYNVEVMAVSLEAAGPERCMDAAASHGYSREHWERGSHLARCQVLADYGLRATLWDETGHSKRDLLIGARRAIRDALSDWEGALDRPMNRIGTTGRQWMQGQTC